MNASSAVYFSSIEIENVRCFGGWQVLDLTGEDGRPVQWSLLIGENGTGKTTLLECLAWMCPVPDRDDPLRTVAGATSSDASSCLTKRSFNPLANKGGQRTS